MEYESSKERLPTSTRKRNGRALPKETIEKVETLLKQGAGTTEVQRQTGVSRPTIIGMRANMEDSGQFELGTWKKQTASIFSEIVASGAERLRDEIQNIPAGQLPLTLAILTDKVMALQDAPAVVVEHRLKVSHEDINSMIRGDIIDLPPSQPPQA